jgi:DNA modification methylase
MAHLSDLMVRSPKLSRGRSRDWYRYYAGYSSEFVADVIAALKLDKGAVVLDPWNGSGTTTAVAQASGIASIGFDKNPALVMVARARLLGPEVAGSLQPLCADIVARAADSDININSDPLSAWFSPQATREIRRLERAISRVLVESTSCSDLATHWTRRFPSALAAFFYLALFNVVRLHLHAFVTTNPTWVKAAASREDLVRLSRGRVTAVFTAMVEQLGRLVGDRGRANSTVLARIEAADSSDLPLKHGEVDAVITSPPYCTRIDYIAATLPELAVLGFDEGAIRTLRSQMLGTPTIRCETPMVESQWGVTAGALMRRIASHSSRASSGYYRKYFAQYFAQLVASLREIHRVGHLGTAAVFVVQDSHYKEIQVDLPRIVVEIAETLGWRLTRKIDFTVARTKAAIHPGAQRWRSSFGATESVLFLG